MVERILEFHSDIEADAGRTLLVLSKEDLTMDQILEFQIAMIMHNVIPGIVKVELKKIDADIKLGYHLDGLISLTNYLKRQKIGKTEFSQLLDNIISILLMSKNYLLHDNSFILKEDFIYINPRSKQISLIYLPVEMECSATQEFKTFLINLLINTATIDTNDNYVQLLLGQIKSEQFSLAEFRAQLAAAAGSDCKPEYTEIVCGQAAEKEKEEERLDSLTLSGGQVPKFKLRKTVLTIAAIVSVISAVISALPIQFRGLIMKPDKGAIVIFGLSLACLLAVFAVMTLQKTNKAHNLSPVIVSNQAFEISPAIIPETTNETILLAEQLTETSLLTDGHYPYLQAVGGEERIVINKTDLTVGRQKEVSDHIIPNKNIGRLHAQISFSDSKYYISDLDSVNGTFINGSRILSNKEYPLYHNDKITLANLEYLFVNP